MSSKKNLEAALKRAKIKHIKKVANFLLRQAYSWHQRDEKGGFWLTKETCPFKDALYPVSQLQADLIKAGFVTRVGEFDKERHQFLPGSKTLRYLNQYLDERGTSGTQLSALAEFKKLEHEARIRSLEEDVKNHSKQLSEIHEAIKEIHEFSPPVTPEKIANHLRLAK